MIKRGSVVFILVIVGIIVGALVYTRVSQNTRPDGDSGVYPVVRMEGGGILKGSGGVNPDAEPARSVDTEIRFKIVDIGGPIGMITLREAALASAAIIGVALVILLITRVIKMLKKIPRILTPYETAIDLLRGLEFGELAAKGLSRQFYFDLSGILRTYAGAIFDLGRTELTTREFIIRIQDLSSIPDDLKKDLLELVRACDIVKFSPYLPAVPEAKKSLDSARKTIEAINGIMKPKESRI